MQRFFSSYSKTPWIMNIISWPWALVYFFNSLLRVIFWYLNLIFLKVQSMCPLLGWRANMVPSISHLQRTQTLWDPLLGGEAVHQWDCEKRRHLAQGAFHEPCGHGVGNPNKKKGQKMLLEYHKMDENWLHLVKTLLSKVNMVEKSAKKTSDSVKKCCFKVQLYSYLPKY